MTHDTVKGFPDMKYILEILGRVNELKITSCTCYFLAVWLFTKQQGLWPVSLTIFCPQFQIQWKLRLAVTPLLAIRSQQIFAHATTVQLSCHVQNFVAITVLELRWEWNEISIEFELRWKNR